MNEKCMKKLVDMDDDTTAIEKLANKHGVYNNTHVFAIQRENIDVLNYSYHHKWHKKLNLIPVPITFNMFSIKNNIIKVFSTNIIENPFKIIIGRISGYLCIANLTSKNKSILKLFDTIYTVIDCPVVFYKEQPILKINDSVDLSLLLNKKNNNVTLFHDRSEKEFKFIAIFNMNPLVTKEMFDIGMTDEYKKFIYDKIFKIMYTNDNSDDVIKKYKNVRPQHFFSFYHMDQVLIESPLYDNLKFRKDFHKLCSLLFIKNGGYDATVVNTDIQFKLFDLTVTAGTNLLDIIRRYVDFDTTTPEGKEEYKKYLRGFLSDVSIIEHVYH